MDFKELLELNRNELFKTLDNVKKYHNKYWRCDDIFEALSTSRVSDKRLINDYNDEEVFTMSIKVGNVTRSCRVFTKHGLIRYIHEGKISDYENACAWIGVNPKNKLLETVQKFINDDKEFKTAQILKWLFEKRKADKSLGVYVKPHVLLEWMEDYVDEIPEERYSCIHNMVYTGASINQEK